MRPLFSGSAVSTPVMPGRACLLALALVLIAAPTLAQDQDLPRRPDGRPDLSGTYDTATLTPLVRPAQFGERLSLTPDEAAELVDRWKRNFDKDNQPSDPDREAPPEGGTSFYIPEFEGAAGRVGGYNAFFVDLGDGAFTIDGEYRTSIITDPPNGRFPPLTAEGERRREISLPFRHENTGTAWWTDMETGPYDDPELRPLGERCILFRTRSGPPTLPAMYNNLKRVIQTDDAVMILAEQVHDVRIIRLDSEPGPADMPKWMGDSVGHWEGDTLVVETTNFLETKADFGVTQELRVVERFSRLDKDTLVYNFTVTDPRFTEPWSGEYAWPQAKGLLYEYACHEGNYALGGILRGARMLEADAKQGAGSSGSTDRD